MKQRIDDAQIGDEIDLDPEMIDFLGKDEAGEPIAVRILLPVQEMGLRLDLQRIGQNRRPAVRRRSQPMDSRKPRRVSHDA